VVARSVKDGDFIEKLCNYHLRENDLAACISLHVCCNCLSVAQSASKAPALQSASDSLCSQGTYRQKPLKLATTVSLQILYTSVWTVIPSFDAM
jgi:hypothetical protein